MSGPIYNTREDLGTLAWILAAQGRSEVEARLLIIDVIAMVDTGIRKLSEDLWTGNFDKQRLFKDFTVTLSGTTGGAIGSLDPTLIIESIAPKYGGLVYSSTLEALGYTGYLDYSESFQDASLPHNFAGIATYLVRGKDGAAGEVICFDETGTGGRFNGASVTVKGAVHYDFATVPEYYKGRLVEIIAQMAREKMAGITTVRQTLPIPGAIGNEGQGN